MKKVLTILVVLTLIAGAAFAVTTDTVTLTTSIGEIAPVFKLYYDKNETGKKADFLDGTQAAKGSIAGGITAKFVIWQEGEEAGAKAYSNYRAGAVELTITCGAFNGTGTAAGYATAAPKAAGLTNGETRKDAKNAETLTYGEATGANTNTVVFKPTYHGKRVDDQEIASFTASWAAAPELPYGDYSADITLTYTTAL